jgi:alkaline phosphatase
MPSSFGFALLVLLAAPGFGAPPVPPRARNIIVLIADGCGSEQYTLARWWQGQPLCLDGILVGAVKTHIADSVVADSAPAATAYATGCRTGDKLIGISPGGKTLACVPAPAPEQTFAPLATVMEGARLLGKATGIVVTCRIPHATPAGYLAHVPHRDAYNDIMKQIVHQRLDVVFGGGKRYLLPKGIEDGERTDGENLLEFLRTTGGYQVVETREKLAELQSGRAFGVFASKDLEAEIDRAEFGPQQPSLAEMTGKAIELLAQDPDGFFLLVEASQVDWAGHANDPAHLLGDLCMYDASVRVALEFAQRNGETLLLALSDHNTGGMSIGNYATSDDSRYAQMSAAELLDPLRRMSCSAVALWRLLGEERTPDKVKDLVRSRWGMEASAAAVARILQLAPTLKSHPEYAIGQVLSPEHTCIGWTTRGHVGGDVPLFAFGPGRPSGLIDAPAVGVHCAQAMGLDLARLTARLFVDAEAAFGAGAVTVEPEAASGPVARIAVGGRVGELLLHTNLLKLDGATIPLEGLSVYIPSRRRLYVPQQAVELLQRNPGVALPSFRE